MVLCHENLELYSNQQMYCYDKRDHTAQNVTTQLWAIHWLSNEAPAL